MDPTKTIAPSLTVDERHEMASLADFLRRLEAMRGRELIAADAYETVVAETVARAEEIQRAGRFRAAMGKARDLATLRPRDALEWAELARETDPRQSEAWSLAVDLLGRLARDDEALALGTEAAARFASMELRLARLLEAKERRAARPAVPTGPLPTSCAQAAPAVGEDRPAVAEGLPLAAPRLSWSSIAGEFLQEHWQKLILCLAVLLIAVSSTVGAHLLLGPRLWSPVGKCALALVYTAMFAGFGAGLVRWGAERAGRMMLFTTLIVVPVDFMLAGEMRLLTAPSASRLVVLALDVGALYLIARLVAQALDWGDGAAFLAAALVALSASDAATARGVPLTWGLAAFLVPPWIFLGAVWRLNTRPEGEGENRREFAYLALGLLTFAFLSGMLRTAVVARVPTPFFAVPAMVAAIACVHTAHQLVRLGFEKGPGGAAMLRFGGLVLSASAFAFALARPPGPSPLYSGNTLATALIGLALYAGMLRAYRHPAYLYLAFGALFVGYFGAFYFTVDLVRAVEEAARQALGYRERLPFAFKSINGLVFNAVLGGLSLAFARRWHDDRLARHCHYLGVPFSIAACLLSALEPTAAVICLSGYAVLYTVAAPLFAQPRVLYLACSALAGALLFGSTLVPGMTLEARALGAAVLGLGLRAIGDALRWRRGADAYRVPLVDASLVLAVAAMAAATASVLELSPVTFASVATFGLAALVCGLGAGDRPHRLVANAMVAGLLGLSLCGFERATGGAARSPVPFGVVVAGLAVGLVGAGEWSRRRKTPRSAVFASALPDAGGQLVVLAVALAAPGIAVAARSPAVAAALALGTVALLGLTRSRRDETLVYLGLGLAVASALVLGAGRIDWAEPGIGLGWLALLTALASLLLREVGGACHRAGAADLYVQPCFRMALALTAAVFVLALEGRLVSRASFPLGALALLANGLAYLLFTTRWRTPLLTYAAVGSLVSATYLTLFSVGTHDPSKAYVLGLVAVVEGIALWAIGMLCRPRSGGDRGVVYAGPLFASSLVLTVLAVVPAHASPVTMSLVAVSFLLMVKSFPASGWLYAALGALGCAGYHAVLEGLPRDRWMAAAAGSAFVLWGLGMAARRGRAGLCRRLGVPELPLDAPLFHATVALGLVAALLRLELTLGQGLAWTAYPALPLVLSALCLLMLPVGPDRRWVGAFAALATLGLAMGAAPLIATPAGWPLAGMTLALAWLVAGRDVGRIEPAACRRLGFVEVGAGAVLEGWSALVFAASALPAALGVVVATTDAVVFDARPWDIAWGAWACEMGALGLAWVYLVARGLRPGEDRDLTLGLVRTLVVWWVGASPWVAGLGASAVAYYPLATAVLALAGVLLESRGGFGDEPSERRASASVRLGLVLSLVAAALTRGEPSWATIGTLLLATSTLGVLTVARHRVEAAYAGGLAWIATCAYLVDRLARLSMIAPSTPASLDLALGATAAAFMLWAAARWLRTTIALKTWADQSRVRVVRALEQVGLAGSLAARAAIVVLAIDSPGLGDVEALAGVGVVLAGALFDLLLAGRWRAEWLVYSAQATLVGAYLDYRLAYPMPAATDAAVLTLLGYLDLGLAEVMQRLRMDLYARPTLYVALVLPLLPIARAVADGRLDDLSLFLLATTATFYAVACYTRQWKTLGYAAAVLFNALLWLAWSRVGWRLADHPQFFLIPVGLSAILFAEVNRRDLGAETVNAIRVAGLMVVYLSLAVPIWQDQSFGSWLTLLVLSLAGILVGIGLRVQSFLWLGLVGFVLDVVYQVARMGAEHALARWGIMLALGILLILFVALNEKKRIVATMRQYYEQARQWE